MTHLRRKTTRRWYWFIFKWNKLKILSLNDQQIIAFFRSLTKPTKFQSVDKAREKENIIISICELSFYCSFTFSCLFPYVKSKYTNKWNGMKSISICSGERASVHFQKNHCLFVFISSVLVINKHLHIPSFIQVQSEWFFVCFHANEHTLFSIKAP